MSVHATILKTSTLTSLVTLLACGCAVPLDDSAPSTLETSSTPENESPVSNNDPRGTGGSHQDGSSPSPPSEDGSPNGSLNGNGSTNQAPTPGDDMTEPPKAAGCEWIFSESQGFLHDGICYPQCDQNVGTDGDGWGWTHGASCLHAGSTTAQNSTSCEFDVTKKDECPPPGSFRCPGDAECGCEIVSGLGTNKQNLWAAGANESPYMFAAAMMETPSMSAHDATYPYGDGKWDDAFNAGVCKQNWGMIRTCHSAWNSLEPWHYDTSAEMNTDLSLDVQVFQECRAHYGEDWWTYHRRGLGYVEGDFWADKDVEQFRAAMDWTHCLLEGHYNDDVRFWVNVNAI